MAWLFWLVTAVVLGVVEAATLVLVCAMLAGGALAASLAAAVGAGVPVQVAVFAVASVGLLGVVRPIARRTLQQPASTRTNVDALEGAPGLVLESVGPHDGRVRINGEVWSARSYDETSVIAPGTRVQVMEIKGAHALVYPVE